MTKARPVAGAAVTWTSPDPAGRFVPEVVHTDAGGVAQVRWILGVPSGTQSARATVAGWDDELVVGAEAVAGLRAVALMEDEPGSHMCALDADGQAWCWGSNSEGQLGDGTTGGADVRATPVRVAGEHRFRSLTGAYGTSYGVTVEDTAWCWGSNSSIYQSGIFGDGSRTGSPVPVQAAGGMALRSLDMGRRGMVCGITPANDGYCWGSGVLGDGASLRSSDSPVLVSGGHAWQEISAGNGDACGITLQGATLCWTGGPNALARMGIEGAGPFLAPTPVSIVPSLASVGLGWFWQCGLVSAGSSAACWGASPFDGDASAPGPYSPVAHTLHRVVTEGETGVALDATGTVWAWGSLPNCFDGPFGGLRSLRPEGVWSDIAVGPRQIYAILASDGTVHEWIRFGCADAIGPTNVIDFPAAIPAPES
jgi:alpha-tubulin suppressor-like RCC1 family protein